MKSQIKTIILYTGSNGRKGCTCNCLGCYTTKYSARKPYYQGNMKQVKDLISLLPNLTDVALFGNPDISVDSQFCNEVALCLQQRKIRLHFSTSGIGGADTLSVLLNGVNTSNISEVIFSVDSTNEKTNQLLKGKNISISKVIEGIEYCNSIGVRPYVLATVWNLNMEEDWMAYNKFFDKYNVINRIINFGSVDAIIDYEINSKGENGLMHIPEDKVIDVRNKCLKAGMIVPYGLATDIEYEAYTQSYKPLCSYTDDIMNVFLEEDGIKASLNCTMLTNIHPEYIVNIQNVNIPVFSHTSVLSKSI
jgi:MoaA/NifB/PqqE/SkfB family radical SAM enzyme